MLRIDPHPLLDLSVFTASFPRPLSNLSSSTELTGLLRLEAEAPFHSNDEVRAAVRDLLRHGGRFKPTGRSKPASEYLIKAANEGKLAPINIPVDGCNAVSLHSGLPISVIDTDKVSGPLHVGIAVEGANYVFNHSGQAIQLGGLLCLSDADGPCANAVKDSQRTKTNDDTRTVLSLVWGVNRLPGRAARAAAWYRQLLADHGAMTETVEI